MLGIILVVQFAMLVYGYRAYRRTAGGLRHLIVLLSVGALLLTARTALHSGRYLIGGGLLLHFWEHVAILAGFAVIGIAAWKVHGLIKGEL